MSSLINQVMITTFPCLLDINFSYLNTLIQYHIYFAGSTHDGSNGDVTVDQYHRYLVHIIISNCLHILFISKCLCIV